MCIAASARHTPRHSRNVFDRSWQYELALGMRTP